jgi:hypothetical protein
MHIGRVVAEICWLEKKDKSAEKQNITKIFGKIAFFAKTVI